MRWSAPTGPLPDPVADLRALHRLQLGTLFGPVGSLLGVLFDLTYRYGNLLTVSTGSSGPAFHSPGPSGDAYVLGFLAAGTVLEVVGLLFLRSTFGALTPNAPQFLWPERFTLLTFVGSRSWSPVSGCSSPPSPVQLPVRARGILSRRRAC